MPRIDELFIVHRASAGLFSDYEPGAIAFVSNGSDFNGVTGFVEPLDDDEVFLFHAIVVNSFSRTPDSCGARVQAPPFVACGRSGNGLLILEPRTEMSVDQLACFSAYINHAHGWRFTWYRQATKDRLSPLMIPAQLPRVPFSVERLLPLLESKRARTSTRLHFQPTRLDTLFSLNGGDYHAESELRDGQTPLVSCGEENDGVVGYYEVPSEKIYKNNLTIAFNGRPLTAKYHPYEFAAKDDVAIAIPLQTLRLTTLLFVQMMLNRERWRYSYYRKCYVDKLRRFEIFLPHKVDVLDEDAMQEVLEGAPYWNWLVGRLVA